MTKVGSIYVEVRGDYTKYEQDLRQVRQIAKGVGKGVSDDLNNAISPSKASKGITDLTRNLMQFQAGSKTAGAGFRASADQISAGLSEMAQKAGLTQKQFAGLQERMLRTQAAAAQEKAFQAIARATGATGLQMVRLRAQLGDTEGAARSFVGMATSGFGRVAGVVLSLKAAIAGLGLGLFAKDVFRAGAEVESLGKAFEAITGNASSASKEMQYVRGIADELGMNFYTLAEAYKGFLAAGADKIAFQGVLDAGAALQLTGEQIKLTLYALQQMASKGTVSMEELRQQLGEQLPGAFELAASSMGMTTQEFAKAVEQGKILATDLLPRLGQALTDKFGKAARENATSAARAVDKFQEAWTDLKVQMAGSGFLDAASDSMRELSTVFKDPSFQQAMRQVAESLGEVVKAMAGIAKYAGLRSVMGTYAEGAGLSREGLVDWKKFQDADFFERQRMVDDARQRKANAGSMPDDELAKYKRGVGNFYNYRAPQTVAPNPYTALYDDAKDRVSAKDLDAVSAAEARSVVTAEQESIGSLAVYQARQERKEKNLELERDFYSELAELTGNNEAAQLAAIEKEYEVYAKVIDDEAALARWLAEEKMRASRDWSDGAILALRDVADEYTNLADQIGGAIRGAFDGATEALTDFVMTGKASFSDFANSIVRDLVKIAVQQAITGQIAGALGNMFSGGGTATATTPIDNWQTSTPTSWGPAPSAKGNVYSSPSLSAYSGQVVSSPTPFYFAKGAALGVMGEAGPEAIMPLKRGADGKLGVAAQGGGAPVVNVVIENHSGAPVQQKQTSNSDGSQEIKVIIGGAMVQDLQSGGMMSQALESTYKLQRRTA